jgi:hypothetical protein
MGACIVTKKKSVVSINNAIQDEKESEPKKELEDNSSPEIGRKEPDKIEESPENKNSEVNLAKSMKILEKMKAGASKAVV